MVDLLAGDYFSDYTDSSVIVNEHISGTFCESSDAFTFNLDDKCFKRKKHS
jgi:hypothetical protein